MRLYSGTSQQFIEDNVQNQIVGKLNEAFFKYFRYYPHDAEKRSWRNSLKAMTLVVQSANLVDHGVILEYQLPLSSKRLDCMICGRDEGRKDNAVIVELKQWEKCESADGDMVVTWLGGGHKEVLHPSIQVGQYHQYLQDAHTAFYEGASPIVLNSCSYLHNYGYENQDPLLDDKFSDPLKSFPIFTEDDVDELSEFLITKMEMGEGVDVLRRVEESKYRPSKQLMKHVANIIRDNSEYILLDEQLVVYDKVLTLARKGFHDKQKQMIIVKGGPGTGKSVIAINLMADLLLKGYNAHYATGSRAFTGTLRQVIGRRGAVQFKYFNSYTDAHENDVDVLIADEAHRIRQYSFSRFTPKSKRSEQLQIDELIKASKVVVFFIDDKQIVRPMEIGSVEFLNDSAKRNNCKVSEYELSIQFRCSGSEAFVDWVNNTLGIERTPTVIWEKSEDFDFRILETPDQLESAIREKVSEGYTGRVCAGFCWKWSDPFEDGTLREDVIIDQYRRPWNAKPEAARLAKGIPKSNYWANDPNGINQIGCIYTSQGFEFDYVGVIFGKDLVYDWDSQRWQGLQSESHDTVVKRADKFTDLVKNTYRVLLTRGLKGCYVFFMDKDTERFIKSRIES
jgi:hypothetical protein